MTAGSKLPIVEPVVGERFDDWLKRWAESEGRALFAARAAAIHKRQQLHSEARIRKAAASFDRLRRGKSKEMVQRSVASWRQPGDFLAGAGLVNSVFALGAVTPARLVTPDQGAGAERREGGATPLSDQQFKDTSWRAPWAPGYALHRPKSTS